MFDLTEQLIRHEGLRALPYQDSLGVWTVGVGHNMTVPLTHRAIMTILQDDIDAAVNDCLHAFPWFAALDEIRQAAIVNMRFNMGLSKLKGFKRFLAAMEMEQYDEAAREMLNSLWAKQVGSRAVELAAMIQGLEEV